MPEPTGKTWRELWVAAGPASQQRGMILFKNAYGKVIETKTFMGDVEVLTSATDASNVQVTHVASSWKE